MSLFEEQVSRKPNLYPWTDRFINAHWQSFWTPNEFNFLKDISDFKMLMTDQERQVLVRDLSAIGQVEIAVKTYWSRLGEIFPHPSMSDLGFVLAHTEVIHNKAYEKLLDTLQLGAAFEENLKEKSLYDRIKYLRKYLNRPYGDNKRKQILYSLVLFTIFVEDVSLFSQFYVPLAMNTFKGGILKDVSQQIQYTRQEETLHANVGKSLINTLRHEHPELFDDELEERIRQETYEALEAERRIIRWILQGYELVDERSGLTIVSEEVLDWFIYDRINRSLADIGFNPIEAEIKNFEENTLWFYEELEGNTMTDFFVKNPIEYSKNVAPVKAEDLF